MRLFFFWVGTGCSSLTTAISIFLGRFSSGGTYFSGPLPAPQRRCRGARPKNTPPSSLAVVIRTLPAGHRHQADFRAFNDPASDSMGFAGRCRVGCKHTHPIKSCPSLWGCYVDSHFWYQRRNKNLLLLVRIHICPTEGIWTPTVRRWERWLAGYGYWSRECCRISCFAVPKAVLEK